MNDGDSLPGRSLFIYPPNPTTSNPWSDPSPSSNSIQLSQNNPKSLIIPITSPRGRSTSIAAAGATRFPAITTASLTASASAASSSNGDQLFSSNLRPRARLRRLRSDLAFSDQDAGADVQNDQLSGSNPITPSISSDSQVYMASNGSTASLGTSRGADPYTNGRSTRDGSFGSITPSIGMYSRRNSPKDSAPQHPTSSSGEFDWDEDDKTREGKARKQGKSTKRTALPSPFSFALGSGFGSKLWGDVETLWNETLSPAAGYGLRTNGDHSGHAYLDVWGRPVAGPTFEETEGSRGRDRSVAGAQRKAGGKTGGPLIEQEDVSTSTTPSLSRKTTDSVKERNRSRNLVSGEGITILDSDGLTTDKVQTNASGETEVFEHVVLPADSLAGVALKYGVTVAQLRKANKMWASDTIHLRKVLYIPVMSIGTLSKKSSTLPPMSGELIDLTTNMSRANVGLDRPSQGERSGEPNCYYSHSSKPASYVESSPSTFTRTLSESTSSSSLVPSKSVSSTPSTKRIPISELSYFPPPSMPSTTIFTSNPHPSTISAANVRTWELQNGVSSSLFGSVSAPNTSSMTADSSMNSRAASPSRNNNGLASSIFQAFPGLNDLNLSNITSRVSFETVRSTGSLPGSGNVSGEEDMELDEMKRRNAGVATSGMPSRGMRKRIKLRPRKVVDEASIPTAGLERGKIITQQLAPRSMELPDLQAASTGASGSYGSGWTDPGA